jgi:uroporphyrin-III C-methyltransferase
VTHRSYASSVAIVTGHKTAGDEVKWGELARAVDTLVILMGMHILAVIIARLQASGCEPEKPVALIQSGTLATKLASSVP